MRTEKKIFDLIINIANIITISNGSKNTSENP